MPIIRTFACPACNHMMEMVLTMEQSDDPPPDCPACERRGQMQQEFRPVALGGSTAGRAGKLTEEILQNDYQVADMSKPQHEGDQRKIRYKDQVAAHPASTWNVTQDALQGAIAAGRQMRLQHGSGLDILQRNLETGAQPDLIELSKRRSMKVW